MKKFVILLAFVFSILSFGNLYANSNVGHNTIALYCIWKMTNDPTFMSDIQGQDRYELTHPRILDCKSWDDLSDAQKAFLQGVNLPDCISFMHYSHNEAPMAILSAMYILKDFCPPAFKNKSENEKAFICRMQRFMTWGSKLHIKMDMITHAKLPYAGTEMDKHVEDEAIWDLCLLRDISEIEVPEIKDNLIKLADCTGPLRSKGLRGLDIRDEYVNFILEKYGKTNAFINGVVGLRKINIIKGLYGFKKLAEDRRFAFDFELLKYNNFDFVKGLEQQLPEEYKYLPAYKQKLFDKVVNDPELNLTVGPTQEEIDNQYDIDVPETMHKEYRRGNGQEMLERVRELRK